MYGVTVDSSAVEFAEKMFRINGLIDIIARYEYHRQRGWRGFAQVMRGRREESWRSNESWRNRRRGNDFWRNRRRVNDSWRDGSRGNHDSWRVDTGRNRSHAGHERLNPRNVRTHPCNKSANRWTLDNRSSNRQGDGRSHEQRQHGERKAESNDSVLKVERVFKRSQSLEVRDSPKPHQPPLRSPKKEKVEE